jgi:hypothetical protein
MQANLTRQGFHRQPKKKTFFLSRQWPVFILKKLAEVDTCNFKMMIDLHGSNVIMDSIIEHNVKL